MTARKPTIADTPRTVPPTPQGNGKAGQSFVSSDLLCAGKTVLSLFDFSGNWSRPYAEAGANVVQLDLKLGVNILDIDCAWLSENVIEPFGTVDAILAAPPCTDFAVSGAKHWHKKANESVLPGFSWRNSAPAWKSGVRWR